MEKNHEDYVSDLLRQFEEQREELKVMVVELEIFKKNLDKLFPEKLDQRYARLFDEKIKVVSEFFKLIVELRKEINKSIKDELEMRRKVNSDGLGKDADDFEVDLQAISKKIAMFNGKKELLLEVKK